MDHLDLQTDCIVILVATVQGKVPTKCILDDSGRDFNETPAAHSEIIT